MNLVLSSKQSLRTVAISNAVNPNINPSIPSVEVLSAFSFCSREHAYHLQQGTVRTFTNTPICYNRSRGRNGKLSRQDLEKEKKLSQEANELYELPLGSLTWEQIQHSKRLIYHLSYTNNFESVKNAENLLERLVTEGRDGGNIAARVEGKLYNTMIGAYGRCRHYDSASLAHGIFDRMTERFETAAIDSVLKPPSPNIITYNSLMNAWCNSGTDEAVERVESLMEQLESGNIHVQPDNISYNTLMNTYANQVNEYGFAQKAEDVLLRMSELQKDGKAGISLSTTSFNTVLKAWKNSGGGIESAKRAEGILRLMIKLHSEGHTGIKPDPISFTSLVHAYAKPHGENRKITSEVADCLEGIADLLISDETEVGKTHGIAATTFGSIIEFIGKGEAEDSGLRAKRLLDKMKDAKAAGKIVDNADTKIYSHVLRCLIKNSDPKGEGPMAMIQDMLEGNSPVKPTTYMMNGVLHQFSLNGDVEGAESFFKTMSKVAEEKGYFTRPDVASYNIMANLYFKSNDKHTSMKAYRLFQHMEDAYDAGRLFEIELFVYSIVINMLQSSNEFNVRQKAYEVLIAAIKRSDDGQLRGQPDSIVFNLVLSSLAKQCKTASANKAVVSCSFVSFYFVVNCQCAADHRHLIVFRRRSCYT